jgi:hypothetical protein
MDEEDLKDELMSADAIKAKEKFTAFASTADELKKQRYLLPLFVNSLALDSLEL